MINSSSITIERKKLKDGVFVNILEINKLDKELEKFIDSHIVSIYKGALPISIELAKEKILEFLNKKDNNGKMGSISEFFIHLFLKSKNYKQECLWSNLEENSMKKGFDGYYSFGKEQWIVESKSGSSETKGISHHDKLDKAYKGLKKSIEGETENNPWENAYYHASIPDVNAKINIVNTIRDLSIRYMKNDFASIGDFNIIPCSTIFFNGSINDKVNIEKINKRIENYKYKELELVCISKESINLFFEYLNKEKNNDF